MATGASRGKGIAKAATFVMSMIFISRLTGFVREMVVARTFGRGMATDAFFAAFAVPDMMYFLLIGGALSSAFIPVFTEYLARDREIEGWEAASTFINVALILLFICTIAGVIFSPLLAPLVAYKFQGEERSLLIHLMRMMFPAVFLTATAGVQMGILNSYRDFFSPAVGPIVYNIGIIVGALVLGKRYGVIGMAFGVVAGALGNVLTQLPFVLRRNKGYKLRIDLHNPGYRKMIRLMLPTLIGLSVTQLNLMINQNLASGLSHGSITALRYANRVMQLPLGIFAMGLSQVIFPTITRQVASGDLEEFRKIVTLGIKAITFITFPAAVGLIVLREPIVKALFQHGAFHSSDTAATAAALMFYCFGLIAASVIQVLTRVFYAMHDTSTPVKTGVCMVLLNFLMNLFFIRYTHLAHRGLALAFSIDGTVNMLLLLTILSKRIEGFSLKDLLTSFAKGVLSAFCMGLAVYTSAGFLVELTLSPIVVLSCSILIGICVYAAIAGVFKMDELNYCLKILKRKA